MNFETEYKNIKFKIAIEAVHVKDVSLLLHDKFNRIPNQTMIELKKGTITPYNLIITSEQYTEERTHYWSNILLTSDPEELLEELGFFLEDEEVLDSIAANWKLEGSDKGPSWK